MSDPKYNKYEGTLRFDDDNIVDVSLEPDSENISVLLNGSEVTGGSGLPDVTAADNGDVLTVVSGEWTNAAPAGGSDLLVVHLTEDEQTEEWISDYTYAEISAAALAGKAVILINTVDGGHFYLNRIPFDGDDLLFTMPIAMQASSTTGFIDIWYGGFTITNQNVISNTGGASAQVSGTMG